MHTYIKTNILKKIGLLVLLLGLIAITSLVALSYATGGFATGRIYATEQGALDGYDVVAYFDGEPKPGHRTHSSTYLGATWYFHTAENQHRFEADPDRYLPQYGGYCAYAMSQGYTAYSDPLSWKLVQGKLYLNYNADVHTTWQQDLPTRIQAADEHWPNSTPGTQP